MSNGQFNAANNKLSRGIAGGIHKRKRIGSFEIGVQPDNNFYLMINRTEMVGKDLPSQDHAISLLHGIFTSNDGSTAGMNAVIAGMLADGRGVLANTTPAAPNYTTNPSPSTTGPFTVGTTLSLSSGVLEGFPTPFVTYQWKKAGANYATTSTITPVTADIGSTFTCDVTATNNEGTDSVTGISFGQCQAIAPSFTLSPVPNGANPPVFQQVSSVALNSFAGTNVTVSYQWKIVDNDGTVNNATGTGNTTSQYTPTKAREDENKVLKCTVTLDNSGLAGGSTAAFDVVFAKIEAIDASINTTPNASTSTPNEGSSVTLSGLSTLGTTPVTVGYQWTRAGVNIAGATSAAYTPVNADVGSALAVVITADNSSLNGGATDVATVAVGTVTTSIGTVTVSGSTTPSTGVATAYTVAYTGPATDVTYQWSATTFGGGSATFSAATSASTNITFSNAATFVVKCTLTSATANDSPVFDTHSITSTSGTAWTVSGTTGIASTLGAFSVIQDGGDDTFDEMGLTQLNVGTTYATFFFFTAYARDEFRTLTSFTLEGNSMNPSTATYEEQNVSSNGFGLKYTGIDSTCAAWIADMQGGSVSGSYVGTTDAMTVVQAITWTNSDPFAANQLASVSSTGTDIISANRDNYTTITSRPRIWNGAAAVAYGASSGSTHSGFQELSGGDAQSDNKACGHFWSMWGITMDNGDGDGHTRGSDQLSAGIWPQYLSTQSTYNNNTALKLLNTTAGAQAASFRVYRSYPKDNRFVKFTTGSTYGACPDVISIHGHTYFGPNRIYWNSWDPGMIDYYPGQLGGENTGTRDGMLRWMADNGNLELWSGGSKVDDLTMSAPNTTRVFMTLDTLTTLTASTEYELKWT